MLPLQISLKPIAKPAGLQAPEFSGFSIQAEKTKNEVGNVETISNNDSRSQKESKNEKNGSVLFVAIANALKQPKNEEKRSQKSKEALDAVEKDSFQRKRPSRIQIKSSSVSLAFLGDELEAAQSRDVEKVKNSHQKLPSIACLSESTPKESKITSPKSGSPFLVVLNEKMRKYRTGWDDIGKLEK